MDKEQNAKDWCRENGYEFLRLSKDKNRIIFHDCANEHSESYTHSVIDYEACLN